MISHGTVSSYTNLGCRCKHCRRAWAQYARNLRVRRAHGMKIRRKERRVSA